MKNLWVVVWKSSVVFGITACLCGAVPSAFGQDAAQEKKPARILLAYTMVRPAPAADAAKVQSDIATSEKSNMSSLPLFTYQVTSSRDDNSYSGVMVGANPFQGGGVSETPTFIIPLIFVLHRVGVSFDPTTGAIGTAPGKTTFDPIVADDACLKAPNDVPLTLFQQSPYL